MTTTITISSFQKNLAISLIGSVLFVGMMLPIQFTQAQTAQSNLASLQAQIDQLTRLVEQLMVMVQSRQGGGGGTVSETGLEGGFTNRSISVGDTVQTTDSLKVRAWAGSLGTLTSVQNPFAQGTVIAGPREADGYTWWQVRYNTGETGWSAENWLVRVGGDRQNGVALTQVAYQVRAGETKDIFTLSVPGDPRSWGVRYLNRAQLGMRNETGTDKPWEIFDEVSFKIRGNFLRTITVDTSDPAVWTQAEWGDSLGYVLDLYDSEKLGYGAMFRNIQTNVDIEATVSPTAATTGNQAWTWFVPDNGIKLWTKSTGDVSHGGFGLSVLVSPRNGPDQTQAQLTEEMIKLLNAEDYVQTNSGAKPQDYDIDIETADNGISPWADEILTEESDIPEGEFRAYWIRTDTMEERLSSELIDDVYLDYVEYGRGKHRGDNIGAYWVGSFELSENQNIYFDMSNPQWDKARLYINGQLVLKGNGTYTFTAQESDTHTFAVEYESHWHAGTFSMAHTLIDRGMGYRIAQPTESGEDYYSKREMQELIESDLDSLDEAKIYAALAYESNDEEDGTIEVTLPSSAEDSGILILSSYSPVNWEIKNYDEANISGVYVYSFEGASTVTADISRLQPYFNRGSYIDYDEGTREVANVIGVSSSDVTEVVSQYDSQSLTF